MAIRKLLRENATLVVGILLPVVVVVLFLLATYIPRLLVDPPRHDLLFAQDYGYSNQQSLWRHEIDIDTQGKLRVRAFRTEPDKYAPRPRLFLYEHLGSTVREISLPLPETAADAEAGVVVEVSEFKGQVIDTRHVAPDGYELVESRRGGGNLLGLFYRGSRHGLAIGKNGAVVALPSGDNSDWNSARFLGWIVSPTNQ
ncbi:MAG: hypothetical protein O2968_09270 [Acidobacteria bacterium]|nr:hypothetical protein [Acidobacteriota bacterium]